MILHLSRRAVVVGLGCVGMASLGAAKGLAALEHAPDLEELVGAARIDELTALYRAGKPVPDFMCLDLLFDAEGRFRVSRNFREGMRYFLSTGAPVEIMMTDEAIETEAGRRAWQPCIDAAVAEAMEWLGLFPADTCFAMPLAEPVRFCYWRGEGWREAGWPAPDDATYWSI